MIHATHIIGLTALESGAIFMAHRHDLAERRARYGVDIAERWQAIRAGGWLLARRCQPGWTGNRQFSPGRSFDYDELAEESGFVFLETHSRYHDYQPEAVWGWRFDAEQLVVECGALVCRRDLGSTFGDAIYAACVEVAATLPRLPRVDEAEIAALLGEHDPELLAHVASESTDPTDALHDAVRGYDTDVAIDPAAVAQARTLATARCQQIKAAERVGGQAALGLLRSGVYCEIVVPERLAIARAVAEIRCGSDHER